MANAALYFDHRSGQKGREPRGRAVRIRDYRFEQRIEPENRAIRQLIEAGLKAQKPKRPKGR
jgi:hypothetical protein